MQIVGICKSWEQGKLLIYQYQDVLKQIQNKELLDSGTYTLKSLTNLVK